MPRVRFNGQRKVEAGNDGGKIYIFVTNGLYHFLTNTQQLAFFLGTVFSTGEILSGHGLWDGAFLLLPQNVDKKKRHQKREGNRNRRKECTKSKYYCLCFQNYFLVILAG